MVPWRLLDTGANIGAYNMAVDEELLARAQAGEPTPVLRLYAWDPPAVSLGRFQKIGTAVNVEACRRLGFDIVRRVTGGRAVLHRSELTYSLVARIDNSLFPPSVHGTYKTIAACLLRGLANIGLSAEMVLRPDRNADLLMHNRRDPACFSSPSWYELLAGGRKIIGSAQRRLSGAFLQHGSILVDYDPALEAEVIPGGCAGDVVTCVRRELERDVPLEELRRAVVKGFAEELRIEFEE